ncbi:zeta toxin family protein [Nocardiopsis sp. NRRL B-16309]|uniref:zeta toxin family protein n=1 Tax=Nocardiopsis sp. NRRL B-16309 TaxID=1519494 RepID=UPI0006AE6AE6|nr:zeta toxin family protein [Nocardiopsis sp. NRRL B-16309]
MSYSSDSRETAAIERRKNRRIKELVPEDVPVRSDGEKPQFIIIAGQQAAGKTTTQKNVISALGEEPVATYDGDDNAKIHPRHDEIMRTNGLQGQSAVGQRLPPGLHEELIGHLRGDMGGPKYDVVASHPFGRKEHADYWLDGFRNRGYETTAVFVATHESNSMLGIAHRYQQDRDDPTKEYGRWVDPRLHDSAYANNPHVAHYLESTGKVDHIYVANRDGEVLYENHRNPDGSMQNDLGAREAITDERNRAPTPQEIARFDSTVAYMRSTDPAVRTEPVDDTVKMTVDYAEQDHQDLRRKGVAPSASGPNRSIGAALQEQLQDSTVAAEPAKTGEVSGVARLAQSGQTPSGASKVARLAQSGQAPSATGTSRVARLAQSGQASSGLSRAARLAQSGILPAGAGSQNTGSTREPVSDTPDGGDHDIER